MASANDTPLHALSFDIEDWFHIVDIPGLDDPTKWDGLERDLGTLVERRTDDILACLAKHRVRATFFMLGWIADRHPALVRRIADAGHELGSHSYWHRRVYTLTPEEFRDDTMRSLDAIERASGVRPTGYRAPSFSILKGTEWAFDVMLDCGITWDASLFPAPRGHGGYPCTDEPHLFRATPSGRAMPELPLGVMRIAGRARASGRRLSPSARLRARVSARSDADPPEVQVLLGHGDDVSEARGAAPASSLCDVQRGAARARRDLSMASVSTRFESPVQTATGEPPHANRPMRANVASHGAGLGGRPCESAPCASGTSRWFWRGSPEGLWPLLRGLGLVPPGGRSSRSGRRMEPLRFTRSELVGRSASPPCGRAPSLSATRASCSLSSTSCEVFESPLPARRTSRGPDPRRMSSSRHITSSMSNSTWM